MFFKKTDDIEDEDMQNLNIALEGNTPMKQSHELNFDLDDIGDLNYDNECRKC